MTVREFASYLGVAERTVSRWEAGRDHISPRPEMQAALDTALARASADARMRLQAAVGPAVFGAGITLDVTLPLGIGTTVATDSDPAVVIIQAGHWRVTLAVPPEASTNEALDTVTLLMDGLEAMQNKLRAEPIERPSRGPCREKSDRAKSRV